MIQKIGSAVGKLVDAKGAEHTFEFKLYDVEGIYDALVTCDGTVLDASSTRRPYAPFKDEMNCKGAVAGKPNQVWGAGIRRDRRKNTAFAWFMLYNKRTDTLVTDFQGEFTGSISFEGEITPQDKPAE